jgi:hypothetical protein
MKPTTMVGNTAPGSAMSVLSWDERIGQRGPPTGVSVKHAASKRMPSGGQRICREWTALGHIGVYVA